MTSTLAQDEIESLTSERMALGFFAGLASRVLDLTDLDPAGKYTPARRRVRLLLFLHREFHGGRPTRMESES